MKEILGKKIDLAFKELGINAIKTYEEKIDSDYKTQVWEVDDEDFEKLCNIEDDDWKSEWGWWRHCLGSNMNHPLSEFSINKHKIIAWDGTSRMEAENGKTKMTNGGSPREYSSLLEYFCDEIGASQPRNVCALATDLARINNIKMSELFKKYQG